MIAFFFFFFENEFSDRVNSAMDSRNLNAKQLSVMLGRSSKTVRSWIVGKHKPRMDNLTALGGALQVSMNYLHGTE